MTDQTNPRQTETRQAARESFSGRTLTEGQFDDAWALTGMVHGEIHRSGSFREKLTDLSMPMPATSGSTPCAARRSSETSTRPATANR